MIKAAAYCRVSTDKGDQLNSLESQKRYFRDYIERNPLWELTKIYVDEGITGTSTKKRYAFHRMLEDAQNHKFDLVLTKEISRFARNTLDSIYYTRKLKDLGIGIIFLNDNINTLESDAELRLTILASIAQEESRKTSDRVKWGQKRSMEQGVVFGRDMLGYDLRDGKLYINEDSAKTVRLIFHKFVQEGKGTHVIARELTEEGIPTAGNGTQWHGAVILRILKNEKYCGDLVQKKTYTPNYLKHEKKYNKGEEEFIILPSHHEPIINRDLFNKAQIELQRRALSQEQKKKYSSRYGFSGLIKCGMCGCSYVSRTKMLKDGSVYRCWRCYEAVQHGRKHNDITGHEIGCNNRVIAEEDLKLILQHLIKNLEFNKQEVINSLIKIIKKVINTDNQSEEIIKLQNKLKSYFIKKQHLIDLFLSNEITEIDFNKLKQKYETDIDQLTREINELSDNIDSKSDMQCRMQYNQVILKDIINNLEQLINGQEWNDTFYRNILEKIVMNDNNEIIIYLKNLSEKFHYILVKDS